MPSIQATSQDFIAVLPLLILAGTGMVTLLWDAFEKSHSRIPLTITLFGTLASCAAAIANFGRTGHAFGGLIYDNNYSNVYSLIFSVAALLAVLLAERYLKEHEVVIGEFAALVLFAACGMIMLASAADLIITFLGLETMSIAFYILAGLFRARAMANEASMKYFLLGSFSAAFFLYGIALIYGSFHSTNLDAIHAALVDPKQSAAIMSARIVWLGLAMLLVGFAFKVAAFPFHQWAPDVYDGAPTVVSGFMSTAGKAGAFSAMALFFNFAIAPIASLPASADRIRTMIALLSVCSMFYGNITAIAQRNIKRMLAYSSIAHAGYLLLGIATLNAEGAKAVAIYLSVYTLMQLGAFGVVALLESEEGGGIELKDYAGLAKRRPRLAFLMAIMMISLAGIPPFGGFFGKYYLFTAAVHSGLTAYTILAVIASLISVYFYLRIIVLMYFREAGETEYGTAVGSGVASIETARVTGRSRVAGTGLAWSALVISAVGLFLLGVLPMFMTDAVQSFFAIPAGILSALPK